ncbi:DUF2815 family protein [Terrisporobacter vanillatitrophus]|uniref:DUF2815 family protein n=1 Tax=Terrisporobacter vanillatitrophus TaxID=3058402 RepID=UPI003366AD96
MSKNTNLRKVIVPCRFSYLHCFEPNFASEYGEKYSVSAIIPKSDIKTIESIMKAIDQAKKDYADKWNGKIPSNLKIPLRDGDLERVNDEAYRGCYFFNANSKRKPEVVDKKVQPVLEKEEVYSGCYGRISVTFYGYNADGNVGIGASLGNIQKIKDGEPLGERVSARDEFGEVSEEDFLS